MTKGMFVRFASLLVGMAILTVTASATPPLKFQYTFDNTTDRGVNSVTPGDATTFMKTYDTNVANWANEHYGIVPGVTGTGSDKALDFPLGGWMMLRYYGDTASSQPDQFSVTMWIKPSATSFGLQELVGNTYEGDSQWGWHVTMNNASTGDGTLAFNTGSEDHSTNILLTSATGAITFGQWQLISIVVDRGANTVKCYVNKTKVIDGATVPGFSVNGAAPGSNNYCIFVGGFTWNYGYIGAMDDMRFYDGLLSQADIDGLVTTVPVELSGFEAE